MLDSDNGPTLSSGRRSLSWLLAGGVVGLVGVGYFTRGGEKHASVEAGIKFQADNCASGGQPSSCTSPEVATMTSYGAWTVCGPNAGLPTQTGVFVGGIEACEAKCAASTTCRGVQWVQGADSTQDICFEISDNICVHHTMTPPVAQGSVPPVQNAECIVKSCGGATGNCVAGQTECCPASLKREVNVAGDKLVQRFARRLVVNANVAQADARVIKKADGTVVVCYRDPAAAGVNNQAFWALGTVQLTPGNAITQTLNPHLKVINQNGRYEVVRYDPANPNTPIVVGTVVEAPANTVACPVEAVQFQGRRLICATGHMKPIATIPAGCATWPFPAGWKVVGNPVTNVAKEDGTVIAGCVPTAPDAHALCETQVFAAADHKAIVCDNHLNVLGMVNKVPAGVEVDDRAFVRFDDRAVAFTDIVVENPLTADGGKQVLGPIIRNKEVNGRETGIFACAGITCGPTSTCEANPVLPPGKWTGLLCVGVSPLPATLRGVFWKVNKGIADDFPFIPDLIAFCKNTDGCGKSLGQINAEGELVVDLRGEKVVDWLGTTFDNNDKKALDWIRENGLCKLVFTSVPGKGSRHSPTWFKIEASCDPTEGTRRLGITTIIPSHVTEQINAFNHNQPFMTWVHGSRYNSLLPRGCTAWALWQNLDQHRNYEQDAEEVTNLEKATSRLVSIVDDRGYTLENCGYTHFDSLYGESSFIHLTYDNGR